MNALAWVALAFVIGALPLSLWLGRLALGVDIRAYGDGNPGAANVWKAGGPRWGLTAILLDAFKGLIPVALAQSVGHVTGWPLAAVACAPILGHAFSPFLRGRGGKALATTFGVWTALAPWQAPVLLGLTLAAGLKLLRRELWAVAAGMAVLLAYLGLFARDAALVTVCLVNAAVLLARYAQPPAPQTDKELG